MIRNSLAASVVFIILNVFGFAQAETIDSQRPILKPEAVVTDEFVRIGDLVAHAGIIARVPIFRAPDLGTTGIVSAEDIVEAVRSHALIGLDTDGLSEVKVTRAARAIPMKDVEDAIMRAIATRCDLGPTKDLSITFDREMQTFYVPPSAKGSPRVLALNCDNRNGHFSASLEFPTSATNHGTLLISGRAQAMMDVISVTHQVERGAILKNADLAIERRPRSETKRDVLTDRDQIIGLAARMTLRPGQTLKPADLTKPELVQLHQSVTLIYQVPGITLTVRGKAAEGGAEGDTISVINEQTKRTVQGVVAGPARVVVSSFSPRLAANIPPNH